MTVEVKVPVLAESVAEANLLKWHKSVGESIQRGDNLIDIETDKVTLEVAAPSSGVLIEILKQDGEDVLSDEVIARIDTDKKSTDEAPAAKNAVKDEANVKQANEEKPRQQTFLEPETESKSETESSKTESEEESLKLSPAVRNLLSENKLETSDIKSHKHPDRITKEDVLNHLGNALSGHVSNISEAKTNDAAPDSATIAKPSTAPAEETAPQPVESKAQGERNTIHSVTKTSPATSPAEQRPHERVPMTRLRKRAAERLLAAQHDNALLTTFNEVNMQPIIDLRNRYKEEFEKAHQVKLGFMSFFTRAAVEALKKFPVINASVDGEDILYRGYFDIGIAVSSERGLVVPVLRDADTLSFAAIESRISDLGHKAKDGKLTIEELTGGTFTITNGGIFGSLLSTPIVNPPQSAILGMHKIQQRPIAENGEVVIRPMMYLALSYDHRIIDGREAVQFLVSIKEQIEDPSRLLLQI